MLHSLMFDMTYSVVLLVLVFLFAWKGKCCNTDVCYTFLLVGGGGGGGGAYTLNILIWKYPLCIVFSVDILCGWKCERLC